MQGLRTVNMAVYLFCVMCSCVFVIILCICVPFRVLVFTCCMFTYVGMFVDTRPFPGLSWEVIVELWGSLSVEAA